MYGDKVNTNFQDKVISNKNTAYKCLSLIILDSLVRANKKYYSNTLEECLIVYVNNALYLQH